MTALNTPVLILNKHYVAVGVASAKHALCMLFRGAAEVVDVENKKFNTYDFGSWAELSEFKAEFEKTEYSWIQSVKRMFAIPPIVRLLSYGEFRKRTPKFNRRNVFLRDNNTCQFCGRKHKTSDLSLDHVVPKSKGGRLEWTNVVCACLKCNVKKGSSTLAQCGMKLIRKPVAPVHAFDIPKNHHKSWDSFVSEMYWCQELKD